MIKKNVSMCSLISNHQLFSDQPTTHDPYHLRQRIQFMGKPRHHHLSGERLWKRRFPVPKGRQKEGTRRPKIVFRYRHPVCQICWLLCKLLYKTFHKKNDPIFKMFSIQYTLGAPTSIQPSWRKSMMQWSFWISSSKDKSTWPAVN